jgi:hypothetical protein
MAPELLKAEKAMKRLMPHRETHSSKKISKIKMLLSNKTIDSPGA